MRSKLGRGSGRRSRRRKRGAAQRSTVQYIGVVSTLPLETEQRHCRCCSALCDEAKPNAGCSTSVHKISPCGGAAVYDDE
ncbi:hypothetical protein ABZP36_003434 [Zizania latifolia]